jgi:hypothetical protein
VSRWQQRPNNSKTVVEESQYNANYRLIAARPIRSEIPIGKSESQYDASNRLVEAKPEYDAERSSDQSRSQKSEAEMQHSGNPKEEAKDTLLGKSMK